MLLPMKFYPDPVLREKLKKCQLKKHKKLIDKLVVGMMETMEFMNGAGLAASQVGFNIRLAVINPASDANYKNEKPFAIVNPKILKKSEVVEIEEGCLSCPIQESQSEKKLREKNKDYVDQLRIVKRYNKIKVKYTDMKGEEVTREIEGKLAQIFQHEIDHLDGKLYLDLLSPMKRNMVHSKIKKGVRKMMNPGGKRSVFKSKSSTSIRKYYGN